MIPVASVLKLVQDEMFEPGTGDVRRHVLHGHL